MEEQNIDHQLREALTHLETAIQQSVNAIIENDSRKKEIGQKWEQFLGQFFGTVKEQGKKSRQNLLSLINFSKIR